MNEDTIRDIYYVEHKWNPHFFYLSPKSFCQDLEKNGSDLYLDLFHAMYQEESDYICPYTENDFSLRKELWLPERKTGLRLMHLIRSHRITAVRQQRDLLHIPADLYRQIV